MIDGAEQSCDVVVVRVIDISRFKKEIEFLEPKEFVTNVYEIECIKEEKVLDTTK